jgi:hypothetical protein
MEIINNAFCRSFLGLRVSVGRREVSLDRFPLTFHLLIQAVVVDKHS